MSAFVMTDDLTMGVAHFIFTAATSNEGEEFYICGFTARQMLKDLNITHRNYELVNTLAFALRDLNNRAIKARYGDEEEDVPLDNGKRFKQLNVFEFFKATRCWIYQCSEGNCVGDPLYLWMQDISHNTAVYIADKTPECKAADCWR